MIRAVIFDCFGVLATDNWQAYIDSLPEGADIEAARQAHREYDAGFISKQEVGERIKQATGKEFVELEDMHDGPAKNAGLLRYVADLHQRGLKLSVLSNVGSDWIREDFLNEEEQKLFDDFTLSYEVGALKPDNRMYEAALQSLEVLPEEAVMVDDKERYCTAAEELGMHAIQFESLAKFKVDLEAILAK